MARDVDSELIKDDDEDGDGDDDDDDDDDDDVDTVCEASFVASDEVEDEEARLMGSCTCLVRSALVDPSLSSWIHCCTIAMSRWTCSSVL